MTFAGYEQILPLVARARARGEGVAILTVVAATAGLDDVVVGTRLFVSDKEVLGTIHSALEPMLISDARAAIRNKSSNSRSYIIDRDPRYVGARGGDVDIFFEVLGQPARLVIVGAGHIALPLAAIGALLDFQVTVLDDRPDFLTPQRFPAAKELLAGPYRETIADLTVDSDTHIVLVTRGHVHDQACLEEVINSPAAYIGMIGSKRRVRTVLRHARERGYDDEALRKVHAPIGLDIGAQTPAEIALAIMAEIVNLRRKGKGISLALGDRLRA